LQEGTEDAVTDTTLGGQETLPTDVPAATMAAEAPADGVVADGTPADKTPAETGVPATTAEEAATTTAASVAAPAAETTVAAAAITAASVAAPAADATVAATTTTLPAADLTAPSPSAVATPATPKPTKGFNNTPISPGNIGGSSENTQDEGAFGSSAGTENASAAGSEAVATASGDAGLYCDGQKSFSVTNLWKGSIKDLEEEIANESDKNQSEELSRNAVLAATIFGSIIAFVLVMESIIGWRVWCEKWIVGLVAIMACISQGVTFLFFNSERYCDGDIVNEILNQEPCVMGQGGIFSVIATVLYGIVLIMACRLPQDDPYGLCGKKDRDASTTNNSNGDLSTGSKFRFLGGSKKGGDSAPLGTDDDGKPERPNWLSEEEDNEVI